MVAKKDLLQAVRELLKKEEDVLAFSTRQLGNASFFSGIPPQNRPDVRAGLAAFQTLSQQHRQALADLTGSILSGGQDVY